MRSPNAVLTLAVALTLSASARAAEAITRKVESAGGTVVRSPEYVEMPAGVGLLRD